MRTTPGRGMARVLALGTAVLLAFGTACSKEKTAEPVDSSPPASSSPASPSARGDSLLPAPVARRIFATGVKDQNEPFTHGGPVLVASVYGVYRKGDQARLALGLTIDGEDSEGLSARPVGLLAEEHDRTESTYDATGLTLVDSAAKKAYLVASDAEDKCLCSPSPDIAAGLTTLITATFAAPPDDVSTIDVVLPKFGVTPDVPITDGPPPDSITSPQTTPEPGASLPPVFAEDPVSSGPVAHAPVVDVTAPVSNLDGSVTEQDGKVVLAADVLFAFDEATLTKKAKSRIARTAKILRKKARGTVHVNGYTDSKGSASYNRKLSKRRAQAVRAELVDRLKGSGLQLVAKGHGEADPVAPNTVDGKDNPKGRALNRRVETVYKQRGSATDVPAKKASASPRPAPTGKLTLPKRIASKPLSGRGIKESALEGSRVGLYGASRHGRLVTLNFGFVPPKGKSVGALRGLFSKTSQLDGNVTGVSLVDGEHSRRYTTARYARNWFCTTWIGRVGVSAGQTFYLTATFSAPPAGVQKVDVDIPHVDTFKGVPLS